MTSEAGGVEPPRGTPKLMDVRPITIAGSGGLYPRVVVALARIHGWDGWLAAITYETDVGTPVRMRELRIFREARESMFVFERDRDRPHMLSSAMAGADLTADTDVELHARMLRELRIGEFDRIARQRLAALQRSGDLPQRWKEVEEGSRRADSERMHLRYALDYVRVLDAGSRSPIRYLATEWDVEEQTARNRISSARRRHGLLSETKRGRAGGELTEKAWRLLRSARIEED